uniref:Envelope glycoprotein US27 n=1 Tax=Panine betaherpesvirus 2 TaxID=188763 RepID=A0A8F7K821_9BETA|nr:envelope glycoprotein US27 [Panine betaherpesvirus 2]
MSNNTTSRIPPKIYNTTLYQLYDYTRTWVWVIGFMGILLNLCVILTIVIKRRKKKSPSDVYLCNIALADLALVFILPTILEYVHNHKDTAHHVACYAMNACFYICLFANVCFWTNLFMDRYSAIVWGVQLNSIRNRRRSMWWSLMFWLFALIMASPHYALRQRSDSECVGDYSHNLTKVAFPVFINFKVNILGFLVPIIVMSLAYHNMVRFVINYVGRWNLQTLDVLLVIVVSFGCFWFPFNLALFLESIELMWSSTSRFLGGAIELCLHLGHFFVYFRACFNPLIYIIVGKQMSKDMCDTFRSMCLCCYPRTVPYQDIDLEVKKDFQRRVKDSKKASYHSKNDKVPVEDTEFLL